jgi:hypothetical protein
MENKKWKMKDGAVHGGACVSSAVRVGVEEAN